MASPEPSEEERLAREAVHEARKAVFCLNLAITPDIAEDVRTRVEAAFAALRAAVEKTEKERDAARLNEQAVDERVDKIENILGNLLARIHRDGGHHQSKVGTEQAAKDAEILVLADRQPMVDARARVKEELEGLARAIDDRAGTIPASEGKVLGGLAIVARMIHDRLAAIEKEQR